MDRNRRSGRGIAALLLGLLVIAFGVGCTGRGAPPPPEDEPGEREEYVIGIPDVLKVVVWRNPELSVEVPVRSDGKISVPLVDDVQAEGLTPEELKEVLTEALGAHEPPVASECICLYKIKPMPHVRVSVYVW